MNIQSALFVRNSPSGCPCRCSKGPRGGLRVFEQRATTGRVASAASVFGNNCLRSSLSLHTMWWPLRGVRRVKGGPCGCSKFSFSRLVRQAPLRSTETNQFKIASLRLSQYHTQHVVVRKAMPAGVHTREINGKYVWGSFKDDNEGEVLALGFEPVKEGKRLVRPTRRTLNSAA